MAVFKSGPPAPGRKTPGPFDPRNPSSPGFSSGAARIQSQSGPTPVNPPKSVRNPKSPKFSKGLAVIQSQPSGFALTLPTHVSGSADVSRALAFLKGGSGSKKVAPTKLPATTDKVKSTPPPASPPATTTSPYTGLPTVGNPPPLPPGATYVPVPTPNLDPYAGKTPAQIAAAQLNPQYAALNTQSQANQAALQSFTQSVLAALKGLPQTTGDAYTQAQNVNEALASKGADLLSGANPNDADQAILKSINAPGSQQDAIANQLQNTFGGGAGVLYNTAGTNAGSALASEKAAATAYANAQPGIQALASTQAERNLLYQDAVQKAAIAAQAPTIENQVAAAKSNALYQQAQFTASQHAATTANILAKAGYNQNNFALTGKVTAAEIKALPAPSTTWSRALGYKADQYGNPVLINGKPQLLPGFKLVNGVVVKAGKSSSVKPLSNAEITGKLVPGIRAMQAGVFDKKTGKMTHPPLSYQQALVELQKEDYFRNPTIASQVLQELNNVYGKPIVSAPGFNSITVPGNESLGAQGTRLGINPGSA